MSVTLAATGTFASTNSGTSLAVNMPASISAGNLLVIHATRDDAGVINTPSGWTSAVTAEGAGSAGDSIKVYCFYKLAAGGDTVTLTADLGPLGARCMRFTGHHASTPIGTTDPDASGTGTNPFTTDSMTPGQGFSLMLLLMGNNDDTTFSSSLSTTSQGTLSMTEVYDDAWNSDNYHMAGSYVELPHEEAVQGVVTMGVSAAVSTALIEIKQPGTSATVNATIVPMTSTILEPTLAIDINYTATILSMTSTILEPTARVLPETTWTNDSKNSTTWTNQSKS